MTNHAITIDASPENVWPWLTQMGWHKGGWYTARWVDRLLFPANWPSATRLIPDLQNIEVGSFIPDGAPETKCGFIVERLDPARSLVLHSTSHLPASWREKSRARLDWSWTFILTPVDRGRRTRFLFRSRWITAPWWFTLFGWLVIVPADFIMARSMLNGIKDRAEGRVDQRRRLSGGCVRSRSGQWSASNATTFGPAGGSRIVQTLYCDGIVNTEGTMTRIKIQVTT